MMIEDTSKSTRSAVTRAIPFSRVVFTNVLLTGHLRKCSKKFELLINIDERKAAHADLGNHVVAEELTGNAVSVVGARADKKIDVANLRRRIGAERLLGVAHARGTVNRRII